MSKKSIKEIIFDANSCGIIYPIIDKSVKLLKYLNLVELFKYISRLFIPKQADKVLSLQYSRNAVDIFIFLKWLFLFIIISYKINTPIIVFIVWYLLITNLYTYFLYHIWDDAILTDYRITVIRLKRRFVAVCISILFSTIAFAYLFFIPYSSEFQWSGHIPTFGQAFIYSVSNSLTAGYNIVLPISSIGFLLSTIQLIIAIIFLTFIIVGSIPQINSIRKDE